MCAVTLCMQLVRIGKYFEQYYFTQFWGHVNLCWAVGAIVRAELLEGAGLQGSLIDLASIADSYEFIKGKS